VDFDADDAARKTFSFPAVRKSGGEVLACVVISRSIPLRGPSRFALIGSGAS